MIAVNSGSKLHSNAASFRTFIVLWGGTLGARLPKLWERWCHAWYLQKRVDDCRVSFGCGSNPSCDGRWVGTLPVEERCAMMKVHLLQLIHASAVQWSWTKEAWCSRLYVVFSDSHCKPRHNLEVKRIWTFFRNAITNLSTSYKISSSIHNRYYSVLSSYSAFRNFFPKFCLILRNGFLLDFQREYNDRLWARENWKV